MQTVCLTFSHILVKVKSFRCLTINIETFQETYVQNLQVIRGGQTFIRGAKLSSEGPNCHQRGQTFIRGAKLSSEGPNSHQKGHTFIRGATLSTYYLARLASNEGAQASIILQSFIIVTFISNISFIKLVCRDRRVFKVFLVQVKCYKSMNTNFILEKKLEKKSQRCKI